MLRLTIDLNFQPVAADFSNDVDSHRLWLAVPPIWKAPPLCTARRVYWTPRFAPSRLLKAGERKMAERAEDEL